ncbi:DUF1266 domain-containing protein [Budviciaceae bacterium BWR-B9]|uniref:DUF1266 domain-containing protein n=1 Tax=Limnobaculum allomyrinae TaxID=2791986 RepID=A0ABS1IU94_9GAMM|nr:MULTISPECIES: DUF1266 domain-containing protein [Limnobaculum]MBK5145262.1 DUF1266 domain-containing protein [Limnobaculum allomyrinae]MBV7693094.1 DUF1266 domain-containing protein [Limnobaculum sp. M2-1]
MLKRIRIIIVFIIFLIAHYQYNFVDNDWAFYIVAGVLLIGSLWEISKFFLAQKLKRTEPEFDLSKMKNDTVNFQLITEGEIFAALAESFYMITETTGATGECYINSLETLDLDNKDAVKNLKYSIAASWDIENAKSAVSQIKALIHSAEEQPYLTLSDIKEPAEIAAYSDYLSRYNLNVSLKGSESISIYNLIRASWLARSSFSCGYIDESQAREYLIKISGLIRQQTNSWEELAKSYLVMYLDWNGGLSGTIGHIMKDYMAKERILGAKLLLESINSPINGYSFQPQKMNQYNN